MLLRYLMIPLIFFSQSTLIGQNIVKPDKKLFFLGKQPDYHRFYIGVRFPQTYYFKSDLHLSGSVQQSDLSMSVFNVTISDLKSHDDGFVYAAVIRTLRGKAQAPPYVITFGYKIKNSNFGIAGRLIHYKQFMTSGQSNQINGVVGTDVYTNYYGQAPFLVNYENTDGHNICILGPEFTYTLLRSKNTKHWIDVTGMIGPGISYPRTDATVMTPNGTVIRRNNKYRISGGGIYAETGFSFTVCNFLTFLLEGDFTVIRNSRMNIISDDVNELYGSQTISAFSWSTGIALTVPVKPFKKLREEQKKKNTTTTTPALTTSYKFSSRLQFPASK